AVRAVLLREVEARAILGEARVLVVDACLEVGGIQRHERLARLDALALVDMDLCHLCRHLGADGRGKYRAHGARNRDLAAQRLAGKLREVAGRELEHLVVALLLGLVRLGGAPADHGTGEGEDDDRDDDGLDRPLAEAHGQFFSYRWGTGSEYCRGTAE